MQTIDIQEEDMRMSMSLLCVEDASEKLQCIFKSHKIGSTFYTENTLHKRLQTKRLSSYGR